MRVVRLVLCETVSLALGFSDGKQGVHRRNLRRKQRLHLLELSVWQLLFPVLILWQFECILWYRLQFEIRHLLWIIIIFYRCPVQHSPFEFKCHSLILHDVCTLIIHSLIVGGRVAFFHPPGVV